MSPWHAMHSSAFPFREALSCTPLALQALVV